MTDVSAKHVFISYVKEDTRHVDKLCRVLEASGIPYWRDRKALGPGDAWKQKIREAIKADALTFLACFSDHSRGRDKSYMNEELTLAAEEFRMRAPGTPWLIPVRFDDGQVPYWELGAGRTLDDLNYADLFGDEYAENAAHLVMTISRIMNSASVSPATVQAALQQSAPEERRILMRRLTKEMLLDPKRRIELDDLVQQETRRILEAMASVDTFGGRVADTTNSEIVLRIAKQAQELWELVEPLCWSMQVAARWGDEDTFASWIAATRTLADVANRMQNGLTGILHLRILPALYLVLAGTTAALAQGRWSNVRALTDVTVVQNNRSLALLDAASPYEPFEPGSPVPNILARHAETGETLEESWALVEAGKAVNYYTPVSEWLLRNLRPVFEEQFAAQLDYERALSETEVFLGILSQDIAIQLNPEDVWRRRSSWFGRETYLSRYRAPNAVERITSDADNAGNRWAPLQAGLFGGSPERARAAIDGYSEQFNRVAATRM